jgi:hypothetical protein
VTSDTTLNKQEIAKQTLDNEQQVGENVIKDIFFFQNVPTPQEPRGIEMRPRASSA